MDGILEIIQQWGGIATGCLGIAGSVFVYLHSDKKLKAQQKQLNELQLELLTEEQSDKKKARLNVSCQKRVPGSYDLVIANSGKSAANNVRLKILTPIFGITQDNNTRDYQSIAPQGVRKNIRLHKTNSDPDEFEIEISWDDEFMSNNKAKMVIGYN